MRITRAHVSLLLLTVVSGVAAAWIVALNAERKNVDHITIAAGSSRGDSYVICQALKTVVARHYPNLDLSVRETGGTSDNLRLLEQKAVQLVTAQADVPANHSARIIAVLFEDRFQLLVHSGSRISRLSELKGKRIALPRTGGQYESFLHVAEHFGLSPEDFQFVGEDDKTAGEAFVRGEADAVFRVRALSNKAIVSLAKSGDVKFLPIEQAAAMQIRMPAFVPSVIPQGAYTGYPPIPAQDLPTVSVERTLLAHRDLSDEIVNEITAILMEHRQELASAIPDSLSEIRPLLAGVRMPNTQSGLGIAMHPGARNYYEKDNPSFFKENADYLALVLTVAILIGSWLWELKRWFQRRQKNRADEYNHEMVKLIRRAQVIGQCGEVEQVRAELLAVLFKAVDDLDQDRISGESFQSFREVWQIAVDAIRERQVMLQAGLMEIPPARVSSARS